jgi:triacylglycerol esterase/lipase EstA (alpha/beta hydrolase family)
MIGHSFGGLLTQILAGRGLAAVSVAVDAGTVSERAAAADLCAEVRVSSTRQSGQPQPSRPADLRLAPLRIR